MCALFPLVLSQETSSQTAQQPCNWVQVLQALVRFMTKFMITFETIFLSHGNMFPRKQGFHCSMMVAQNAAKAKCKFSLLPLNCESLQKKEALTHCQEIDLPTTVKACHCSREQMRRRRKVAIEVLNDNTRQLLDAEMPREADEQFQLNHWTHTIGETMTIMQWASP